MLQSQFNLDHRLAELRQTGAELRQARAVRESSRPARTIGGTIRSLFGGTPAADRPAGLAAA
jgi:hypothetical protein